MRVQASCFSRLFSRCFSRCVSLAHLSLLDHSPLTLPSVAHSPLTLRSLSAHFSRPRSRSLLQGLGARRVLQWEEGDLRRHELKIVLAPAAALGEPPKDGLAESVLMRLGRRSAFDAFLAPLKAIAGR